MMGRSITKEEEAISGIWRGESITGSGKDLQCCCTICRTIAHNATDLIQAISLNLNQLELFQHTLLFKSLGLVRLFGSTLQ